MHLVDTMVGESMAYDDIFWTVQIENIIQWEEMLRGEGINDANPHEHVNRYYNFFCFITMVRNSLYKNNSYELFFRPSI